MENQAKIKHLYWRAGFGLSPQEWPVIRNRPIPEAVRHLFAAAAQPLPLPVPAAPSREEMRNRSAEERDKFRKEQRRLVGQTTIDWIARMADTEHSPMLEKMVLFWHGHFACTTNVGILALQQLNVLRANALGNFRDLLLGIARDPAMIRFLNNQQNRKDAPNENFARELMELFTMGRGHYTEGDVKAAARAFTGWSSTPQGKYIFRARQHDFGEKTFLGQTGNFDGEDIIDLILQQPATATFICGKLFTFFVHSTPDTARIAELAAVFRSSNYEIGEVMQYLFTAPWFYAPAYVGNRIKSPVELLAGLVRQLQVTDIPPRGVIGIQRALGQQLFRPPNVAGWAGGRNWIDNATLAARLNLPRQLFGRSNESLRLPKDLEAPDGERRKQRLRGQVDPEPLRALCVGHSGDQSVRILTDFLLSTPPPAELITDIDPFHIALQLLSSPEYQLC